MSNGIWWPYGAAGSRERCLEAVRHAAGQLGLGYGEGHLEELYRAAYADGLRDAYEHMRNLSASQADGVARGWLAWGGRQSSIPSSAGSSGGDSGS